MRTWPAYRTLWVFLLLGWTVSAADRALTGPVITWMIENDVAFLKGAENPYALGGLIGGLFFAGYMLTQFPGGYLGDKYGHRTIIVISLIWAGIATMISGVITGLVAFIAVRVITGLGEGAFYSNDRSLIAQETPQEKRSLGMGFVITGLSIGITIAVVFTPNLIELGSSVFAADQAWRMPFLVLGAATLVVGTATALYFRRQERGLPFARATLHLMAFSAVGLAAVMGVYFIGDAAGLSDLWIAVLEVALALTLVGFVFTRRNTEVGAVLKSRDLVLINIAFIAVLWNLWFFSFWSVSIVADAAGSSFGRSAMIAAFNAGAGILGFPVGGWLSDVAVRRRDRPQAAADRLHERPVRAHADLRLRGRRRRRQRLADGRAAVQREHVLQRHAADRARDGGRHRPARVARLGLRHEQPDRGDRRGALARGLRRPARRDRRMVGRHLRRRRPDRDGDRALPVRQGGGATGRGAHRKPVPASPRDRG